jgi:uncharacterized protein (TIGR03083 family)
MAEIAAQDLQACREAAVTFLERFQERDWHQPIPDLSWDCERALQHLINTEIYLAMHLALSAKEALPFPRGPAAAAGLRPSELLVELQATSALLAAVIRDTEPGARAFYGGDRTDRSGVAAVACDELLIHSWDIGRGFGENFNGPTELAARVAARLFPWAPRADAWSVLLWCNGRMVLGNRPRLGPNWLRWLAPLDEWDGVDPTRAR